MLAAGDTFRAAAVEQLKIWGERTGARWSRGQPGADAAGLAFDALEPARDEGADVLLIDTAGRLHNKAALMEELRKIVRVLRKLDPDSAARRAAGARRHHRPERALQVEIFKAMVAVTGLVVTKLDGTAKGGVLVALAPEVRAAGACGRRRRDGRRPAPVRGAARSPTRCSAWSRPDPSRLACRGGKDNVRRASG